MRKFEIIERYAALTGRTKVQSAEIFEEVVNFVYDTLLHGENIDIRGFGVLETYVSKSKLYHDITGQHKASKEKVRARFRPSKSFVARLNEDMEN